MIRQRNATLCEHGFTRGIQLKLYPERQGLASELPYARLRTNIQEFKASMGPSAEAQWGWTIFSIAVLVDA